MKVYKVYVAIPIYEIDCIWYQFEEYSGVAHTKYKNAKDELRKALSIKNRKFEYGVIRPEEVDEVEEVYRNARLYNQTDPKSVL